MIAPPRRLLTALLTLMVLGSLAGPALARGADAPGPVYTPPPSMTAIYPSFRTSALQALRTAEALPRIHQVMADHPDARPHVFIASRSLWTVYWISQRGSNVDDVAVVFVDGVSGRVKHVWTGIQTTNVLARGHFAHLLDSPFVWVPLCLLFLAPFFDRRRPLRALHLDLLALLAFAVSDFFFTHGHIYVSVPLVYPVLAYLLGRMLWIGFRGRRRREPLVPHASNRLLVIGLVLLVVFRIGLNVANDKVIDVGYVSVEGAHRIMHNQPIYVNSGYHDDTYGPIAYVAYVPFEQIFHWDGRWDSVPAAHLAAIAFDLLTLLGLLTLGRRMRAGPAGRRLGLALAFAWAAYPFSLYPLALNSNDALIAMLLVWALVAVASPPARGILTALAGAAKFAPLALAPLLAAGRGERRLRSMLVAGASMLAVVVVSVAAYLPRKGGLHVFWESTLGFQLSRPDAFSIWNQHHQLALLELGFEALAVCLAVAVAFFPRRREWWQVAALGAAVLIAVQLPARYWFYFYIAWFAPFAFAALFGRYETDTSATTPDEVETAAIVGPGRLLTAGGD